MGDRDNISMADNTSGGSYIELTAAIVSAYVSNNSVQAGDLSSLISQVHSALTRVSSGYADAPNEPLKPAISVKKSITPDHIVGEVGEVLIGKTPGRANDQEITLFKSLGLAIEDLASAHYLYAEAKRQGAGVELPPFHGRSQKAGPTATL